MEVLGKTAPMEAQCIVCPFSSSQVEDMPQCNSVMITFLKTPGGPRAWFPLICAPKSLGSFSKLLSFCTFFMTSE